MRVKIFVSHASKDVMLATALVDCIFSSMVLADSDLRCTSVPGHKLPVGSDFVSTILDDIGDSAVVVGLLTSQALTSGWVLFELGATCGSKKNLKPLVADDVDLKSLPGPLSGAHAARLSNHADIAQFLEEVSRMIGVSPRSASKIDKAIDDLSKAHGLHVDGISSRYNSGHVKTKTIEPVFAKVPFSELVTLLRNEKISVPAKLSGGKADVEMNLLSAFLGNARQLADGFQSNWERDTAGGFMYHEIGLRLLPYGLTHFDRLPAAQAKWFKRIVVSPEGQKFLLHCKRAGWSG